MAFPTKAQSGIPGPAWALLPLRLFLGAALLVAGVEKLRMGERWVGVMADQLKAWRPESYDFYRAFLDHTILPNKALFASLVSWGEALAGAALLIGLLTRLAALGGVLITANIMLAQGTPIWMGRPETAFLFGLSALMLTGAGRYLGVDGRLAARWPRVPLW